MRASYCDKPFFRVERCADSLGEESNAMLLAIQRERVEVPQEIKRRGGKQYDAYLRGSSRDHTYKERTWTYQ